MPSVIRLHVSHETNAPGPIQGFGLLWAYYVKSFKEAKHCQECFGGALAPNFNSRNAPSGVDLAFDEMDRFPFLYICGVANGPEKERGFRNLHLPVAYLEGGLVEKVTYNGYRFVLENAQELPIPALREGFNGHTDKAHYRCKNYQFGVAYLGFDGHPPTRRPLA